MSPWTVLAGVVFWGASVAGSYVYGHSNGVDSEKVNQIAEKAKQDEIKQAIEATRESARQGAADEIAKIKIRNTTVQGKVTTVVRDNPVYRDCLHDERGLRLINEALTTKPSGSGRDSQDSLPRTVSPLR